MLVLAQVVLNSCHYCSIHCQSAGAKWQSLYNDSRHLCYNATVAYIQLLKTAETIYVVSGGATKVTKLLKHCTRELSDQLLAEIGTILHPIS